MGIQEMPRPDDNDAIARAVAGINAIAPGDLKGRASVSQGVVLRLLDAAGWDVFDPSQVRPGYSSVGREISYALMTPQNGSGESPSPRVLVEVRSLGESLGAARRVNRLLGCCAREGAPLGVLTDGLGWSLFLHTAGEDQRACGFCEMDLAGNPGTAAEGSSRYLTRDRVANGEAFRLAERVLRERNLDEWSRRAIIEGWREECFVLGRPAGGGLPDDAGAPPGDFERILELRGRRNPYFSRVAGELQTPRAIGDTGIFAFCQGGGAQLAVRARRVVDFFGHPPEPLVIRTG